MPFSDACNHHGHLDPIQPLGVGVSLNLRRPSIDRKGPVSSNFTSSARLSAIPANVRFGSIADIRPPSGLWRTATKATNGTEGVWESRVLLQRKLIFCQLRISALQT